VPPISAASRMPEICLIELRNINQKSILWCRRNSQYRTTSHE
jgi:hypothetical protein